LSNAHDVVPSERGRRPCSPSSGWIRVAENRMATRHLTAGGGSASRIGSPGPSARGGRRSTRMPCPPGVRCRSAVFVLGATRQGGRAAASRLPPTPGVAVLRATRQEAHGLLRNHSAQSARQLRAAIVLPAVRASEADGRRRFGHLDHARIGVPLEHRRQRAAIPGRQVLQGPEAASPAPSRAPAPQPRAACGPRRGTRADQPFPHVRPGLSRQSARSVSPRSG
jgi:hypothetical protein